MGCPWSYCCFEEGDKVERVLQKFVPTPAAQALDNNLQKIIGRVVLAGNAVHPTDYSVLNPHAETGS